MMLLPCLMDGNEGTEGVNHLDRSTQMKLPPLPVPFISPVTFPVLFFSVPVMHPHGAYPKVPAASKSFPRAYVPQPCASSPSLLLCSSIPAAPHTALAQLEGLDHT